MTGYTGQSFPHMLYHFVLTYSNWETASICFSESFESLAEGFQRALWKAGGVPRRHRTDSLSAAVKNLSPGRDFTARLTGLMLHYGIKPTKTNPKSPNENGDCESLHGHLKDSIEQALLLRGSRDFASREAYQAFIDEVFEKKNAGRTKRFEEEREALGPLPARPIAYHDWVKVTVRGSSTIVVKNNVYSVPSRLIGEEVKVRVFAEHLEVWYAQRCTERLPRLHGKGKHRINYRHVIDSLVRKPGAFENYRWHDDLFPSVRFRMAYDELLEKRSTRASREYLKILYLAARVSESAVERAIERLLEAGRAIESDAVKEIVETSDSQDEIVRAPEIPEPDFDQYDMLFESDFEEHSPEEIIESEATSSHSVKESLLKMDMESLEYGENEGTNRGTDGDASRAASADGPHGVRGGGPVGREPIDQLRTVSVRTGPQGVRGATREPDREIAAAVEDPAGEDARSVRDDETTSEGEPPGEDAHRRRLPRPR